MQLVDRGMLKIQLNGMGEWLERKHRPIITKAARKHTRCILRFMPATEEQLAAKASPELLSDLKALLARMSHADVKGYLSVEEGPTDRSIDLGGCYFVSDDEIVRAVTEGMVFYRHSNGRAEERRCVSSSNT